MLTGFIRAKAASAARIIGLAVLIAFPAQAVAQTPTPTATPAATATQAPTLTIRSQTVNLRSGPGLTFAVTGKATRGQKLAVVGRNAAGSWWQVKWQGGTAWVSATLVTMGAGAATVPVVRTSAAATPATTPPPSALNLPPFREAVTLDASTTYPVRARSVKGWGYELVDASEDYDLLVNRDIFGLFINRRWPDLLQRHPKGMRITFKDPAPGVNYQGSRRGFGDGESAWVADIGCSLQHEEHGSIWPNDAAECSVTLVAPGPGLSDLAIIASVLGYLGSVSPGESPVFDREPYTLLGGAGRDVESGQWRWSDPFLQVVSLKPEIVAAPATPAPKGPLPPLAGRIAFTRGRNVPSSSPAGISEIAVVDVKTGAVRVVAEYGRQPDMRNDGRIVFNGEGGGRDDLQTAGADGRDLAAIGMHPEDGYPSWSTGTAVGFHSSMAGGAERIFVQWNTQHREEPQYLEVDNGSNLRPFTGRFPVWVGERIAYSGCDEWASRSNCGLNIVNVGGLISSKQPGNVLQLTRNPEDRPTDAYGETILFASPKAGNWDLYSVLTAGGKARALTASPSLELGGTYSPDGAYIAYMSDRDGWGIWIMESDGANPRRLIAVPEGFGKLWDQDHLSWGQ